MKRITLAIIIASMMCLNVNAALRKTIKDGLKASLTPTMLSLVERDGMVDVKFEVDVPEKFMSHRAVYMITPYITDGQNLVKLTSMVIEGKRGAKRLERKGMKRPELLIDAMFVEWDKEGQKIVYHSDIAFEDWMQNATLMLDERFLTRYRNIDVAQTIYGKGITMTTKAPEAPKPVTKEMFITTNIEQGRVRLNFLINSAVIDMNLANNRFEMACLENLVETIHADSHNKIDSIVLTASSSPDGLLKENTKLTQQRAMAVKNFFKDNKMNIPMNNIKVHCINENWDMLKTLLYMAKETNNAQVMKIFDISNPDQRSKALRHLPQWNFIKNNILPQLRYVQYKIYYKNSSTSNGGH